MGEKSEHIYVTISLDELERILELHKIWHDTKGKDGEQANFQNIDLEGIDLRGRNLQEVRFSEVNLKNAILSDIDFSGAGFHNVDLTKANLRKCTFIRVGFNFSNLTKADLRDSRFLNMNFQGSVLTSADFRGAIIEGVNFRKAKNIIDIDFSGTDITYLEGFSQEIIDLFRTDEDTWLPFDLRPNDEVVSQKQLNKILKEHELWMSSGGEHGKVADFRNANLLEIDLSNLSLPHAVFIGANLYGTNFSGSLLHDTRFSEEIYDEYHNEVSFADLTSANFKNANLRRASLRYTNLTEVDFTDASLTDANLTDTKGLLSEQLAGTDVTNAKLPEEINKFWGLVAVDEAAQNYRKIFHIMLLFCAYCWLTIFTTNDVELLTNSPTTELPIIGASIPIVGFFVAAPLLLLGFYAYFHVNMKNLWELLAELPAVFPDGRPLDKKAYPWMLIGLVRAHFYRLKDKRPSLSRLQNGISIFLAWWVVPLTLLAFWARYLTAHDWGVTNLHIIVLFLAIGIAVLTYKIMKMSLKGEQWQQLVVWKFKDFKNALNTLKLFIRNRGTFRRGIVGFAILLLLIFMSYGSINGVPHVRINNYKVNNIPPLVSWEVSIAYFGSPFLTIMPRLLALVGCEPYANFAGKDVSMKPENWTGDSVQLELVKGANLSGKDLRYANLSQAFLVKADLFRADLRYALLIDVDFRSADLRIADLRNAYLFDANFQNANLNGAVLKDAHFLKTNLKGAVLYHAKGLTVNQLQTAYLDSTTILPDYLKDSIDVKSFGLKL
ncbi:MAG: pentapeptide repeat-containing protein [candidate division Zixibacteria bacterium]|nr:pentapeptide repeat-containing protein [candidate division Zixibacteria bacterium]